MQTKKLPKKIYVCSVKDQDLVYLNAQENFYGFDDGTIVGIYELKEEKIVTVTTELI